ncbi:MAG TPA: hypothetical protein VLG71_03245 [Candidatus Limnocylindria bacterium]|nr:hypothetical protein [Candidatus Limnocylindria bacterium]
MKIIHTLWYIAFLLFFCGSNVSLNAAIRLLTRTQACVSRTLQQSRASFAASNVGKWVKSSKVVDCVRRRPITTAFTVGLAYHECVNRQRKLLYMPEVGRDQAIPIGDALAPRSQQSVDRSLTYQNLCAMALQPQPAADIAAEAHEIELRKQVQQKIKIDVGSGPLGLVPLPADFEHQLEDAAVFFAQKEARYADTHYATYHGTYQFPFIAALTLLRNACGMPVTSNFFPLRSSFEEASHLEHATPAQAAEYMMKRTRRPCPSGLSALDRINWESREDMIDHDPVRAAQFLSATTTMFGGTRIGVSSGENAVVFITPLYINAFSFLIGSYAASWLSILFQSDRYSPREMRKSNRNHINNVLRYNWSQHSSWRYQNSRSTLSDALNLAETEIYKTWNEKAKECLESLVDTGALIQLLMPKDKMGGTYSSLPYGKPNEQEKDLIVCLERARLGKENPLATESRQVRIPLVPSLFDNNNSGVIMHVVIFAHEQKFKNMMNKLQELVDFSQQCAHQIKKMNIAYRMSYEQQAVCCEQSK